MRNKRQTIISTLFLLLLSAFLFICVACDDESSESTKNPGDTEAVDDTVTDEAGDGDIEDLESGDGDIGDGDLEDGDEGDGDTVDGNLEDGDEGDGDTGDSDLEESTEETIDYFYSTEGTVAFTKETDFTFADWGSGAVFNFDYTGDATYSPCIHITSGNNWGEGADTATLPLGSLTAGFVDGYTKLVFKVNYSGFSHVEESLSTKVKFSAGEGELEEELAFMYADVATKLDGNWYQLVIPLSNYTDALKSSAIQFAIMPFGTGTYLITDIGLIK